MITTSIANSTAARNTAPADLRHTHFGMPVSGRARVSGSSKAAALSGISGQKCALFLDVIDYRSARNDAFVTTVFPGSPAWSPPI